MSKSKVSVSGKWLPALTLLLLCATAARAQQQISGRVTAAGSGEPIAGAYVRVRASSVSVRTDASVAVRIRGVGTVGNTQPLFVVDGLPVGRADDPTSSPLRTIDPNDIESISVLKDASAAAVYGMQAANGVVLIQTRRGRAAKPTVGYRMSAGVQEFPKRYHMLNSAQWFDLGQESFDNYNAQFGYTPGNTSYRKFSDWLLAQQPQLLTRNTDWHDLVAVQNAPLIDQSLSVSAAGDRTTYYRTAGDYREDPTH